MRNPNTGPDTARQDIATAVSTVAGITCTPYYRQSLKPGQASVRLGRMQAADNGIGLVKVWEVWIALDQDVAKAEKWLEAHHPDIEEALDAELIITTVTPAEFVLGAGNSINGVIYEGTR